MAGARHRVTESLCDGARRRSKALGPATTRPIIAGPQGRRPACQPSRSSPRTDPQGRSPRPRPHPRARTAAGRRRHRPRCRRRAKGAGHPGTGPGDLRRVAAARPARTLADRRLHRFLALRQRLPARRRGRPHLPRRAVHPAAFSQRREHRRSLAQVRGDARRPARRPGRADPRQPAVPPQRGGGEEPRAPRPRPQGQPRPGAVLGDPRQPDRPPPPAPPLRTGDPA